MMKTTVFICMLVIGKTSPPFGNERDSSLWCNANEILYGVLVFVMRECLYSALYSADLMRSMLISKQFDCQRPQQTDGSCCLAVSHWQVHQRPAVCKQCTYGHPAAHPLPPPKDPAEDFTSGLLVGSLALV